MKQSTGTCRLTGFFQMLIWFLVILVTPSWGLRAQELTGQITGVILDEQGGVIPGAAVTATLQGTGITHTAVTGDQGRFVIPQVRAGDFRVTVEMPGFRRAVVDGVTVEVGGVANLRITLEIGTIQNEIMVTSDTAVELVNTTDAELGAVVDERRVLDLPLNGRNASQLALLQAGVFFERSASGEGNKLFIHGQRHRSLQITLDGIDTQDNLNRASSVMLEQPLMELSAEHVQEFRVVTGIGSAEFTRGGAHISAVTKGGTNDWHGSLFEFHRNTEFNANNFFNNSSGADREPLIRNQFGGSISGPIIKDKTFFYFGYEQMREARGININRTVWTQEARNGIFRYLDDRRTTPEAAAANPELIRSVNLFACGPEVQATLGRDCVDSRFNLMNPPTHDPFIQSALLPVMPLPNNFDVGDGLNTGGFRFNASSNTYLHKPSFRLDHRLSENHNLNFTFNYNDREIDGDFVNGRLPIFPELNALGTRNTLTRAYSVSLNSSFGANIVNELRAGAIFGENGFLRNQPFAGQRPEFTLDFDDISDVFDAGGGDTARNNITYNIRDVVSWIRGNHQFKFGGEWRRRWVKNRSFFGVAPFGEIDFNDTDAPPGFSESDLRTLSGGTDIESIDLNNGEQLINNLVGAIGDVEITFNATSLDSGFVTGAPEIRKWVDHELDLFFQDNWNIRPGLTLNLGLRWEYVSVPDTDNGLALLPAGSFEDAVFGVSGREGLFNPGVLAGTPCPMLQGGPFERTTDNAIALITGCATRLEPAGSKNGRNFFDKDVNNFAPVIGLAWDPFGDGKTSIRAGFRISYQQDVFSIIHGNVDDNEGLRVSQVCEPVEGSCQNNLLFLRDVFSTGLPPIPSVPEFELPAVRSILDSSAQDFRTFDPDLATPYYQEWTLGIQREIFPNWVLDVRYVGNHGVKLRRFTDFNEININAVDDVTGMSFLDSFLIAQQNLACNRSAGFGNRFDDTTGADCIVANPLMSALIAGDASRLRSRSNLLDALDFSEVGEFVHRLTQSEISRPGPGEDRIRGGSFWGAVLSGRLPANFFQANPFVASSRALVGDSTSTFHAIEVELQHRFSGGFFFQGNYSFGRALTDNDGDSNTLLTDHPSPLRNRSFTQGEFAPRHIFRGNWVWELPFGANKMVGLPSPWMEKVFGGWQLSGIVNWLSGRPLSITSGAGTFLRSAISDANTVDLSDPNADNGTLRDLSSGVKSIGDGVFLFDPCLSDQLGGDCTDPRAIKGLLRLPEPGRLGKVGQSIIFKPRSFNFDFTLSKRTQITEYTNLEFRWEVFNAFNNVAYADPSTDIFSSNFGQITSTLGSPRLMQFALRLNF